MVKFTKLTQKAAEKKLAELIELSQSDDKYETINLRPFDRDWETK